MIVSRSHPLGMSRFLSPKYIYLFFRRPQFVLSKPLLTVPRTSNPTTSTTPIPRTTPRTYTTTAPSKMRIPYAPNTPAEDASDETKAIYTRISERRKPRPLIPLDLALLHNPSIADGWNTLLGAIRSKTSLNSGLMEMAVSRIAILNGAVWEWMAHAPLALKGGLSRDVLALVRTAEVVPKGRRGQTEEEKKTFSNVEWAVLCLTDQMTKEVEVDEGVFEEVKSHLGETGVMEIVATVATYNCVSRFLVAMNVGEKNGLAMDMPAEV